MQEIIHKLDNWTIIKIFGGTAVIVTAIVGLFYKIVLTKFSQSGEFRNNKKLEDLKGEINKNNGILNTIIQNYFSSSQKIIDKKIQAYDLLWTSVLRLKNNFPSGISAVYQLLIDSEIEKKNAFADLDNNPKLGPVLRTYNIDKELQSFLQNNETLSPFKPYLSDTSFKLYYTYQALIGRLTHQFIWEYSKCKLYNWKTDEHLMGILKITLSQKELTYVLSIKVGAFTILTDLLEYKILQDIRENINIKHSTTDTIEFLKDLEKIYSASNDR